MAKTAQDQFVSCIPLPAMASSVATARMHTRLLMSKWHLLPVVDDAELVVSEIVTNAIKATNIIPPQTRYPDLYDRMEVVCLCFYQLAGELVVEVWDPKREPPQCRDVTLDDEGGRGLVLVEALSKRWGTRWPPTGGKVVWASLPLDTA
ncbi:ATP-binding protein [Nonomuraea sp. NPDC026600]|uniref:ATP-binding protein n=1 Tax=Nonomuraea sp. NPDC026600 TaxID=3155363 RepID=UPI0033EA1E56